MSRSPLNTTAAPPPSRSGNGSQPAGADRAPAREVMLGAAYPAVTLTDPAIDEQIRELCNRASALRGQLREEQAATEQRGAYSPEMHERFVEAGFYRILQPRRFGGLELGVTAFFRVISEVARGCPSTAWCLCLGAGHSLQIASYFPARAQAEIFGANGYVISPESGNCPSPVIDAVDGGFRVSGTWRYCSGAPYSTHFMARAPLAIGDSATRTECWFVVDRAQVEVLDDWGGIIGMRGSGSNSVRLDNAFVPEHWVTECSWLTENDGPTAGSILHDDTVYAGVFMGFGEGEIAAVAVGTAMAAIDEYEDTIRRTIIPGETNFVPGAGGTMRRADHPDYQRWLGTALAWADAATATTIRGGQLYEEYARQAAEGIHSFSVSRGARLNNMYYAAQELAFNAVELLLRNGSASALLDGRAMQRYHRDMTTVVARGVDSLQPQAAHAARVYMAEA